MKNLRVWILVGVLGTLGIWYFNQSQSQTSQQANQDATSSDQAKAVAEWTELRNNGKADKGRIVVWPMKVSIITSGTYTAEIQNYLTSVSLLPCKLTDDLHENDYLIVKGKFYGVNDDGYIVLKPLEIKNLGVQ